MWQFHQQWTHALGFQHITWTSWMASGFACNITKTGGTRPGSKMTPRGANGQQLGVHNWSQVWGDFAPGQPSVWEPQINTCNFWSVGWGDWAWFWNVISTYFSRFFNLFQRCKMQWFARLTYIFSVCLHVGLQFSVNIKVVPSFFLIISFYLNTLKYSQILRFLVRNMSFLHDFDKKHACHVFPSCLVPLVSNIVKNLPFQCTRSALAQEAARLTAVEPERCKLRGQICLKIHTLC